LNDEGGGTKYCLFIYYNFLSSYGSDLILYQDGIGRWQRSNEVIAWRPNKLLKNATLSRSSTGLYVLEMSPEMSGIALFV